MSDEPVIRTAGEADARRTGELDRGWTPILDRAGRFQRAASKGRLLVAELEGDLVGYAAQGRFFGYDFLELLAVRPDKRRQRIATALVRAAEDRPIARLTAEACRQVHDAAHSGVIRAPCEADASHRGVPRRDPDPKAKPMPKAPPASSQRRDIAPKPQRHANGSCQVVLLFHGVVEEDHDPVPGEPLDPA